MKYMDLNTQNRIKAMDESSERNGREEKKKGGINLIAIFLVLVVAGVLLFIFREKISSIFDPIAIVNSVTNAELDTTDGRTNILILGSDKRATGEVSSGLTDTLLVASIGAVDKDVVLISLPRDLWVNWVDGQGRERYSKINAVYPSIGGGNEQLVSTVEEVLGIQIHYYTLVTFAMFEEVIDVLGGINVDVENSFTDTRYPIEGKENAPMNERYETISFEGGTQTMDGKTALKYVRSRKGDNGEGTDFARSKRQQKVIAAIKEKAVSIKTLVNPVKLKELYDVYSSNVDTNINFGIIQNFYLLSQQIDFDKVISIVLDDRSQAVEGGLLYAPEDTTLYGGQYVLVPQTGDYSQIHAYVQKYLFGDK